MDITKDMSRRAKRLKDESGKTYQDIAQETHMSQTSVHRYISGDVKDADPDSYGRIMAAIGGDDDPGEDDCAMPAPQAADTAPSLDEIAQQHYQHLIAAHDAELARMQELYNRTIRYKNRWINFLSALLLLLFVLVIIVLLIDITNPNVGWFRHLFGRLAFARFALAAWR
nr:MAG TPA: Regulatory protein [Caudoviricetes sp.]